MDEPTTQPPTFNLWTEPWLTAETCDGDLLDLSIADVLRRAHSLQTLYDPSPLVVMGVHRLLVAILQAAYAPQRTRDLVQIWRDGHFDPARINRFGEEFAHRFDLFSPTVPFLQSGDIPLQAARDAKTVAYLFPDLPAGTAVTHYTHLYEVDYVLCAACAAKGLLTTPAFASSGGAGIKPSINGVPPIYLLPGGKTYFESLTASLTTPRYQPTVAAADADQAWWQRPAIVEKKGIVGSVGYLHSLTFPARRIRLHPAEMTTSCSRCAGCSPCGVSSITYEMGESRADDAALWEDPFAAYVMPSANAPTGAGPRPLRPKEGQAYWREFSTLFLKEDGIGKANSYRPKVLDQLDEIDRDANVLPYGDMPIPFRLIGVRTDGKMKYFEWQEEGFLVSPRILHDSEATFAIQHALDLAEIIAAKLASLFRQHFGGEKQDRERYRRLKSDMSTAYWQGLAAPFRAFVLDLGNSNVADEAGERWATLVLRHAEDVFRSAAESTGTDGSALRRQVEAINHCKAAMRSIAKLRLARKDEDA